jgi:hypothetical protein
MEKDLADKPDVPRHLLWDTVTSILLHLYATINKLINIDGLGLNPHRWFSQLIITFVTYIGRGHDRRATFEIPEELHEYWQKPPNKKRP